MALIKKFIFIFVFLLICFNAHAATWYVATDGDNGSGVGSIGNPWLTINYGISQMSGGDTLNIRVGTYTDEITSVPNGSGPGDSSDWGGNKGSGYYEWPNATTIAAYNGETVLLKPNSGSQVLKLHGDFSYIIFDGLIFDGVNQDQTTIWLWGNWHLEGGEMVLDEPNHHLRFINSTARNAARSVISPGYNTEYIEFINVTSHDSGPDSIRDSGWYIAGSNVLLDGCTAYNNAATGASFFSNYNNNNNGIIRNSKFYNNGTGLQFRSGTGNIAYNNVLWSNTSSYPGIYFRNGRNAEAYNNTIYNNNGAGIEVDDAQEVGQIIRNNILYNNGGGDIVDNGTGTIIENNLTLDGSAGTSNGNVDTAQSTAQMFTDADGADDIAGNADDDLSILTGSDAKDAGTANVNDLFTDDILGTSRPQGDAWDIGAYEFIESGDPDIEAPTTPTNLSATDVSESQIDLTWTASTDDTAVVGYRIYRDDFVNKLDEIGASTSYSDTGLSEGTYEYKVSAFDLADNESGQSISDSATISDTTNPTIVGGGVNALSNVLVSVEFSEDVELASAETVGNYSISDGIGTPSAAVLQPDLNTVYLTVSTLDGITTYTLTVNNVKDRAATPNTMDQATPTFSWSEGLIMWFDFNSSEGQIPTDKAGTSTAVLGTTSGAESSDPTYVVGYIGDGVLFDGGDDVITLVNAFEVENTGTMTFSLWVNLNSFGGGGFGRFISEETGATNKFYFHADASDNFGGEIYNTEATGFGVDGGVIEFATSTWHMVWWEFDEGAATKTQHLYLGSDEVEAYSTQEELTGTFQKIANPLRIGNRSDGARGGDGIYDQVKMWNKILTSQEKQDTYDGDVAARAAEVPVFSMKGIATGSMR
jgi:hypothetical protein